MRVGRIIFPAEAGARSPTGSGNGVAASHADTRDSETAAGPEEAVVYEGLVAGKSTILGTNKIKYRVLILREVDEQTAVNGRQRDLERAAVASNGAWYEVSREQFDLIRRGQRVKAVSTNEQLDMRPPFAWHKPWILYRNRKDGSILIFWMMS